MSYGTRKALGKTNPQTFPESLQSIAVRYNHGTAKNVQERQRTGRGEGVTPPHPDVYLCKYVLLLYARKA